MPRGSKRKKHSDRPKKNLTAYMLFSQEWRDKVKEENPNIKFGEAGKVLGHKWKELSQDDRQKYERLAAEEKVKYQKAIAQYRAEHPHSESDSDDDKKRKKRRRKDPNAPKQALSAYFIFSQKIREQVKAQNPEANFGDIGRIIGQRWKDLPENDRKVYQDLATKDKDRYQHQMAEYRKSKPSKPRSESESESGSGSESGGSASESGSD